mmetsp:Transcript_16035/g.31348  ORF Transcript_16035/g.31348 Transcript_16035/m.31348 type:complete len:96 (-) Transcript_16035:33-320(-)|eukprot:CAMPEP_0172840398 /NCGR_PEP_ID=MMETSP1075-20121228/29291_1 /TAXON_ID=2916 /ORGANISM="Ceratium fusus, Strain PA161109" /LENGTH=95 /DNA_ID=CAMNT_0013684225 /DNA_START=24 /DNA_END=311 /DNA_ORIENTATION=-
MSAVELRKWGLSPEEAKKMTGDEIKQRRLAQLQAEASNWPPESATAATSVDQARQDMALALAMMFSPRWKAFRPELPGGPWASADKISKTKTVAY